MARIRSIKPEFWADEKMSLLDPLTRLVFLGLICMADDAGRLVDNVKLLDGLLFPNTDDTCVVALEILAKTGRIVRYRSASGQQLVQIVNWRTHQKVDNPSKYNLPGPDDVETSSIRPRENGSRPSASDHRSSIPDHRSSTEDQRAGAAIPERDLEKGESGELSPADLKGDPDITAFVVRHYPRGETPPARRRDVVNQLLATLGAGARYRRSLVKAHSIERLAAKCREVLREGMKDPDKAIVVLLAKLSDTSDLSAERQRREFQERAEEERTELHDVAAAEAWLVDRPDIAAAIDVQLDAEGLVAGDALQDSVRRITARSLLLAAWRADGAPELASKP